MADDLSGLAARDHAAARSAAAELADAERWARDAMAGPVPSHLSTLLAEYDRRGAELERVHSALRHESEAHATERGRLRARVAELEASTEVSIRYGWRRPSGQLLLAGPGDTLRHVLDMAATGAGVPVQWEVRTSVGPVTEVPS